MVYVLNKEGKPLMPCSEAKARKLLKTKKAHIVNYCPFTIQLDFDCENKTQDITLGVDAGSKTVGLSATTETKELYASNVELRNDIVRLLSDRRALRSSRRSRKRRYRKARFDNRVKSKRKGWLAPSVLNRIDTHLKVVENVYKILPITKLVVEVASFDIQKIKNPEIQGVEYQQGEQLGFWNVRECVLFRDNHECQCCHGKSKDPVLNVHHIESRKTGGDAPNNLITLCETCHHKYHQGEIELKLKRGWSFRDATFMGIMRWTLYNKLQEIYQNVHLTYGYITKNVRIKYNLPKDHYIDARCISGNPQATPLGYVYYQRKVRCHNRQLFKLNALHGGRWKSNQAKRVVLGFRLFDKVKISDGKIGFIFGRRTSGYFSIKTFFKESISTSINYKNLSLMQKSNGYIISKEECCFPPMTKVRGLQTAN